ncbi:MAG: aminotransferase class III-fold pyridoxal phosphate-dependent enzyme, partial [Myxococcota bacterium]
ANQAEKLAFSSTFGDMSNGPSAELSAKLAHLAPTGLSHVHFTTGGSTAIDSAYRLACFVQAARGFEGRHHIIAREHAYHGSTHISMSIGNRDGDRGHIDYDHAGGGIALGVDRRLGPWVVSGYLGGTFGTLEVDDVGDGEFSSLELGVAARLAIANGHVRGVVGYGHGFHDQDRDIRVGNLVSTASGDFDSDRVLARLEGGAAFPLMAGLDIEPIGSVEYTWLREDRVTESGGGAAALRVDARSHGVLATTAGVRLSTQLTRFAYLGRYLEWSVGVWRAELDARWHSTWQDADRDIEAQLAAAPGAAPFEVEAEDGDQGVLVQLGTTFQPYRSGVLVGLRYRGYLANGRQVHSGLLQLEVPL